MDINPLIEKNIDLSKRLGKALEEIAELKTELALRWETIETYISDIIALAERQRQEIAELKAEVHKYKSYYLARFGKLLKEDT